MPKDREIGKYPTSQDNSPDGGRADAASDGDANLCRCGHVWSEHKPIPTNPNALSCEAPGCWCGGFVGVA